MNKPSSSQSKKTLWKSTPSRWLLFNQFIVCALFTPIAIFALFPYFNIEFLFSSDITDKFYSFLANNKYFIIGLWGLALFSITVFFAKYLSIRFENYILTERSLDFNVGVLSRSYDQTLLFRIVDITVELPILLRILGRGHVIIYSNDPSDESSGINGSIKSPDGRKGVYLSGIKNPREVKELIFKQVEEARNNSGMNVSELM